jgi:hypothetical protein
MMRQTGGFAVGATSTRVEVALLRDPHRVLRRHDAELRAVGVDDAHLARAGCCDSPGLLFDLGYAHLRDRGVRRGRATNSVERDGSPAPARVRGATVPAAASRSPTTAMTGTFASCASRTL